MATGRAASELMSAASKQAAMSQYKKYTAQPTGFWSFLTRWLAIDPNRSTGVPLNPTYRNPPPGGNDPLTYDDPVTTPAGDIADNPYWKRDVRRAYPKQSVIKQPDVVALLSVGSAANPKEEVLQIGDAGTKQLAEVKEEGERGLSAFFEKDKNASKGVLGPNGLPPLPGSRHPTKKQYELLNASEQAYPSSYPARSFA